MRLPRVGSGVASDIMSPLQMTQAETEHEQLILKDIQRPQELYSEPS